MGNWKWIASQQRNEMSTFSSKIKPQVRHLTSPWALSPGRVALLCPVPLLSRCWHICSVFWKLLHTLLAGPTPDHRVGIQRNITFQGAVPEWSLAHSREHPAQPPVLPVTLTGNVASHQILSSLSTGQSLSFPSLLLKCWAQSTWSIKIFKQVVTHNGVWIFNYGSEPLVHCIFLSYFLLLLSPEMFCRVGAIGSSLFLVHSSVETEMTPSLWFASQCPTPCLGHIQRKLCYSLDGNRYRRFGTTGEWEQHGFAVRKTCLKSWFCYWLILWLWSRVVLKCVKQQCLSQGIVKPKGNQRKCLVGHEPGQLASGQCSYNKRPFRLAHVSDQLDPRSVS